MSFGRLKLGKVSFGISKLGQLVELSLSNVKAGLDLGVNYDKGVK